MGRARTTALIGLAVLGLACTPPGAGAPSAEALRVELERALRESDPLDRYAGVVPLLRALEPANVDGLVGALEELAPVLDPASLELLVSQWARLDPPAAFRRVLGWPRRESRRDALGTVVFVWAQRDPQAAAAAVRALPGDDSRLGVEVAHRLVEGWTQSGDGEGLTDFVAELPPGKERQTLTTTVAREQLRVGGPDALKAWADAIPEDASKGYKRVAFRKAARMLAQIDPRDAVAWLEAHDGRDYTDGAARLIATMWVQSEPGVAIEWVLARPESREDPQMLRAPFRIWANTGVTGLGEWLEPRMDDPSLTPGIEQYARVLARSDPVRAIAAARRIQDEARRDKSLADVAETWLTRDREAATQWLVDHPLPPGALRVLRGDRRAAKSECPPDFGEV